MTILDILTRHVTEFTARLIIADLIKAGVFRADPVVIEGEWTQVNDAVPAQVYKETTQ